MSALRIDDQIRTLPSLEVILPFHSPISHGFSSASLIEKASSVEAPLPRHRPQLEAPKRHYMLDLIDLNQHLEETVSKELSACQVETDIELASIERFEKEKEAALIESAKDAASRSNWAVLFNVSQYLASSATIAVGFSVGGPFGGLLVASGVLGMGNRVIQDTMGWKTVAACLSQSAESQKRIASQIEMGISAVELAMALTGGFGAASKGAFSTLAANATRLEKAKRIAGVVQSASALTSATSQVGMGFAEERKSLSQKKLKELNTFIKLCQMDIDAQVLDSRNWIDTASTFEEVLREVIKASEIQDL